MSVQLDPKEMEKLIDAQEAELSDKLIDKLRGEIKESQEDKKTISIAARTWRYSTKA